MIIWRGHGYLGFVLPVFGGIVGTAMARIVGGYTGVILAFALFIAPLAYIWNLGTDLNREPTVEMDIVRGKVEYYHDLYFIKLQYWAVIWAFFPVIFGLAMYFRRLSAE